MKMVNKIIIAATFALFMGTAVNANADNNNADGYYEVSTMEELNYVKSNNANDVVALTIRNFDGTQGVPDLSEFTNLEGLGMKGCEYSDNLNFINTASENLEELYINSVKGIKELPNLSKFDNLEFINISDSDFENVDSIADLDNLVEFYASNCNLESLPDLSNTKLKTIKADENRIREIPELPYMIESIDFSYNEITSVENLVGLSELRYVILSHNHITNPYVFVKDRLPFVNPIYTEFDFSDQSIVVNTEDGIVNNPFVSLDGEPMFRNIFFEKNDEKDISVCKIQVEQGKEIKAAVYEHTTNTITIEPEIFTGTIEYAEEIMNVFSDMGITLGIESYDGQELKKESASVVVAVNPPVKYSATIKVNKLTPPPIPPTSPTIPDIPPIVEEPKKPEEENTKYPISVNAEEQEPVILEDDIDENDIPKRDEQVLEELPKTFDKSYAKEIFIIMVIVMSSLFVVLLRAKEMLKE